MNIALFAGSILGLMSVGFGAYLDHALKTILDARSLEMLATALRYHQLYSILISAVGIYLFTPISHILARRLKRTAYVFVIGVLLFSFSIYLAAFFKQPWLLKCVPFGGTCFMIGWLMLISTAVLHRHPNSSIS